MATLRGFEEIEGWQLARKLTREIYSVSGQGAFAKDFGLRDQIRRSSVSVMSNIAEGFERDGSKEFIQFLSIAKGSLGELRTQLYVALDQEYINQSTFDQLNHLADETARKIGGLISYLRKTKMRGTKYK